MSKLLDKIVVVDLEATCWKGSPPEGEVSDIIEIGVVLLDVQTLELSDKRSLLIKPGRSTVSPFCTELTTITPEMVENGISFYEACNILRREYDSKKRLWASFGDYDRNMMRKSCEELDVPYPFGHRHLNVKTLAALMLGKHFESGVPATLKDLDMKFKGTHHRGDDDAENIARILGKLVKRFRLV